MIDILRKEGIRCAIDDFGIRYSSLSYLKKLSFDTLKIAMAFIKNIEHNHDDIELLLEIDKELVYQGFLFSKPIPMDIFTKRYLAKQNTN